MKALIIGFGFAGSVLSEILIQQGIEVDVMDAGEKYCASHTGSGIINPITGKRLVLDLEFPNFYSFALNFYQNWSKNSQIDVWKPKKYCRVLTPELEIFWKRMFELPEYLPFTNSNPDILDNERYHGQKVFEILGAGFLDFPLFQEQQKKKIKNIIIGMEQFIPQKSSSIQKLPAVFENDYDAVFLTEGSLASTNPFLQNIPWTFAKGETLILHIPDLKEDRIIHDEIFILPLGADLYKIGTSHQWDNLDFLPTEPVKDNLIQKFQNLCKLSFQIIEHKAGIRPVVRDRKPFMGVVQGYEKLFVINGLGSKGALRAPLCANIMVNHWLKNTEIPEKWDIKRFY